MWVCEINELVMDEIRNHASAIDFPEFSIQLL
jgi:hypothetical protein